MSADQKQVGGSRTHTSLLIRLYPMVPHVREANVGQLFGVINRDVNHQRFCLQSNRG
jgi:hypothetical protein